MRKLVVDNYIIETPLLDIVQRLRIINKRGLLRAIEPKGDYIMITCPHHKDGHEAHPDCGIYIGEDSSKTYGFTHCFACDWAVPFTTFVQECLGCSEVQAKQWLCTNYGILDKASMSLGDPIRLTTQKTRTALDVSVLDSYNSYCPYLAKRGLSRLTCSKFNVKFDAVHRQVVFPCYDELGSLQMLVRRAIDSKIFYMDKNVEKPVYCLDYILKNNIRTAIITEGPFDCLTAYEYGYPAIATLGTPSRSQIDKINKSCLTTIYLMFDNDLAGQKFTDILKKQLDKRILIREVQIPDGYKDINDLDKTLFLDLVTKAHNSSKINVKFAKKVV